MYKVDSYGGFDFYMIPAKGNMNALWNIVPTGSKAPEGGYRNREYIERIKGIKFPDRYQPTQQGMTELYPHQNNP